MKVRCSYETGSYLYASVPFFPHRSSCPVAEIDSPPEYSR